MKKKHRHFRHSHRGAQKRNPARRVEGILQVHRDGFGFVRPLRGEDPDIYVPVREAQRALDGDRVLVEIVDRGGTSGRLLKVLTRARVAAVGTYLDRGRQSVVLARDRAIAEVIRVPKHRDVRDGELVKVRLQSKAALAERAQPLVGEVVGRLDGLGDTSLEVLSIAYAKGFDDQFGQAALTQAQRIPNEVLNEEASASGRTDLRSLPLVTIDGEDARDFDDAVYAETRRDGWRLVVAIADVAHYVQEGAPLDDEARRRGTSVYMPGQVLPMLPERLSNGICSLVPHRDRLCLTADLIFDRRGKLRSSELYPGVMRSAARCTYAEVEGFLKGRRQVEREDLRNSFLALQTLAVALGQMRERRGAIDFDLPETRVVLGDDGSPVRVERRERLQSHRLIEEAMLAANEAVAKFFQERELPTIYRYHGQPDEEKLAEFGQLANAFGFQLREPKAITSRDLNLFLEKLEGHPEQRALNQLLLRSMMQAVYSAEEVGHYGLGAEHYLHFTSPIRRYPDLVVHRLLKAAWQRGGKKLPERRQQAQTDALGEVAAQSSERERAAIQVERDVTALYSAVLMKDRVGGEFDATVSSLVDFGFFVELDGLWVEGLVKAETVGPDFRFDKKLYAAVAPSSRLRVRVGQRVRVRLVSVNVKRRQMDFELVHCKN